MWQSFVASADPSRFALLSVAVDLEPERVRPYAEGLPFPTAVDRTGALGRLLDFDVVPNGLFLDEDGVIRLLHVGGFDIRRPEVAEQVQALVSAADLGAGAAPLSLRQAPLDVEVLRTEILDREDDAPLHLALGDALLRADDAAGAAAAYRRAVALDPSDWSAAFGLGSALDSLGQRAEALAAWRQALALDPANFTVRKQIWRAEHPQRFYPEIDMEWQKAQLAQEGYTPPGG